jgi:hypothetical protein
MVEADFGGLGRDSVLCRGFRQIVDETYPSDSENEEQASLHFVIF